MSNRLPLAILAAATALAVAAPGVSAKTAGSAARAKTPKPACKDATLQPSRGNVKRMRAATICLLNVERTKRGLRPLRRSDHLTALASAHSADMVKHKYFGHNAIRRPNLVARLTSTIRAHAAWRAGENIAWGTRWRGSPKAIVALWMNSHGHRANVLNPGYREVGVGIALGNPFRGMSGGATYTTNFYSKV